MSRFVEVEEALINVDHIVSVQRHKNYTLSIFLDNGNVVKVDCACGHIWKAIAGRDFLVATAPCSGISAAIDNEEGTRFYPVRQLGITGDGKVRPLCVQTDGAEFLARVQGDGTYSAPRRWPRPLTVRRLPADFFTGAQQLEGPVGEWLEMPFMRRSWRNSINPRVVAVTHLWPVLQAVQNGVQSDRFIPFAEVVQAFFDWLLTKIFETS